MSTGRGFTNSDTYDAVVVGGGLAGLTAAWFLRDWRILLLESEPRSGGRIKSQPADGYWLNFGAHLFPGPGSVVDSLTCDLGLETTPVLGSMTALELEGKVLSSGRIESYPFRLRLRPRERLAFSWAGLKVRRAVGQYKRVTTRRNGESEADVRIKAAAFLSGHSFSQFLGRLPGRAAAIFRTAAHRIPAEPDEVSAGAGVSLFAEVWGGKDSFTSRNLIGGSSLLPEAMARSLGSRLQLRSRVVRVSNSSDSVEVTYERDGGQRAVSARQVIVAAPANVARRLVQNLPPKLERALAEIKYGPFLSMALLTRETASMPWDSIYAMACAGRSFDMFFNHANILRQGRRRSGGSLMVYAGSKSAEKLLDKSDDEIRNVYLRDLYSLYPVLKGLVREALIERWNPGNAYRPPGPSVQPELEQLRLDNIHLAGDYFAEQGGMETAARTGREVANRVRRLLSTAGRRDLS